MTMFVDRRKENYDELLMLAGDSRISRARTNRWTTGLIVSAMAATSAYVATTSEQVDNLSDAKQQAEQERDTIRSEYEVLLAERNTLKVEIDVLGRYQDWYLHIAPELKLSNSIEALAARLGPERTPQSSSVTQFALSNVVWIVDGSRRFPLADGDILWIPEVGFWIRLDVETIVTGEPPETETEIVRTLTKHGTRPGEESEGEKLEDLPYRTATSRGSFDCIEITLHDKSLRPGFTSADYVDIEVLYSSNENCTPDDDR